MGESDGNPNRPQNPEQADDVIPSVELTIDDAIDRCGTGPFQRRLVVASGLCFGADAAEVMILSFLTTVLAVLWDLDQAQTATIFSSVFVGQILGILILSPLADRMGRRPTFILTALIVTVFGFLTAAANSYGLLIFFRVMVGFGVGGVTIPFDALAEFLPSKSRGRRLIFIKYFWALGAILVCAFAYATLGTTGSAESNPNGWRVFVSLCAIPTLLAAIIGFWAVPESPRWLLAKHRNEEALNILRMVAKYNDLDPDHLFPKSTVLIEEKEQEVADVRKLFTSKWRKTTILMWIVWATIGFSFYGVVQSTMHIFSSTSTHPETGDATYSFNYLPILISAASEIPGTTISIVAINKMGRGRIQVVTYLIGGVMFLGLSLAAQYGVGEGVELAFSFLSSMFYMSGAVTTWVHTAELLPTALRLTGHGAANLMAKFGGFASPYLVECSLTLSAKGGIIAAATFMTAIAAYLLPETRGQPMGTALTKDLPQNIDKGGEGDLVSDRGSTLEITESLKV